MAKVPRIATNKMLRSLLSRSSVCRIAAAAAALLIPCTPCLGEATLRDLGFLPGGNFINASGVSADGSTVVGLALPATGFEQAFRWTDGGGMVGLVDLPGGDRYGFATAVSADGSTVVGLSEGEGFREEAVLWTSGGGIVSLGFLPGGISSSAWGVSADGSSIVGASWSASGFQAFVWTEDGGMVGLGDLPGGTFESIAIGISGDGSTVVGASRSASGLEAFRWTVDDGMVGLGDLTGGIFRSQAKAISADGSTVVGDSNSTAASGPAPFEAFRWTSDGGMVGLGFLAGGTVQASSASAVSADGSTIVGNSASASASQAFVWTEDGGMQSLWDVLLASGVDPAADGWTALTVANGVSADGDTIVGYGTRNGDTAAFMVVLSESGDGAIDPAELVAPRIALSGGNVDLVVRESVPGRRYLVETSVNALEGTWTTIGTEHVGDGGPLTISVPHDPVDPRRFYRLVLDPPPAAP